MDFEGPFPADQSLPYEPIKFVYTETIGSVIQKFKEIVDPYTWSYEDILEPKLVTSASKIQYYLFHTAPIYNWLRKVDSSILSAYVNRDAKQVKPNHMNQNNRNNQFKRFEKEAFLTQIKHYSSQWQIVKLCVSAKVRIITTKTESKPSNKLHQQKHNDQTRSKNISNQQIIKEQPGEQMRCTHLIKKERFTPLYSLNNFEPHNLKLECSKVFCQDCNEEVQAKTQIVKYPFAPHFERFHGKQFSINSNSSAKIQYQLIITYASEKVYVKSSGGVWYQITRQKSSIVSFDKIDTKSGLLFVYQQVVPSNKILKRAQTMKNAQQIPKIFKHSDMKSEDSEEDEKIQSTYQKAKELISQAKKQPQKNKIISQADPQNIEQQDEQNPDEPLEDMSKTPLPIVMNKKKTDRKLFKEYKRAVEGLLPKQRQKDEYEKNYDKGKTKKIHKNRQEFRTANFFELYKKGKHQPSTSKQNGQNNNWNEDNQNEDQNEHKNTKSTEKGPYREKDEQYNEVFQGKKSDQHRKRFDSRNNGNGRNSNRPFNKGSQGGFSKGKSSFNERKGNFGNKPFNKSKSFDRNKSKN